MGGGRIEVTGTKVAQRLTQPYEQWATGDGATAAFPLTKRPRGAGFLEVFVAGLKMRPDEPGTAHDFAWDRDTNRVTLTAAPALNAAICFRVHSS